MKIIVGLGNPEKKYENSRHNLGFMVVDAFVSAYGLLATHYRKKFESLIIETTIRGEKVILAKPQTHMNLSGKAVKKIIDYYKSPLENLIVIHDDIDIPFGKIKLQKNRSSAGHRGVQSIIDQLNSKNFYRIRIGIRNFSPDKKPDTNDYVMSDFTKEEKEKLKQIIEKTMDIIISMTSQTK